MVEGPLAIDRSMTWIWMGVLFSFTHFLRHSLFVVNCYNHEMSQKFVLRAYVSYSREEPTDVDNELCVMHARTHGRTRGESTNRPATAHVMHGKLGLRF